VRPAANQFYGERSGTAYGQEWNIGHHLENVTPEEISGDTTK